MSGPPPFEVGESSLLTSVILEIVPTVKTVRRLTRVLGGFNCIIKVHLTLNTSLNKFSCHKHYKSDQLLRDICPGLQFHDAGVLL